MAMSAALVPGAWQAGARSLQPRRAGRMLWITAARGSCFLFIAWGLRDAPALWFAALRTLTAGAALVTVGFLQRRQQPQAVRDWSWLTLIGLVNESVGAPPCSPGSRAWRQGGQPC